MFPASVRFWIRPTANGYPSDDIREKAYKLVGDRPSREGDKWYLQFQGDYILDMPDKFIPKAFISWVEKEDRFEEVSIMSTAGVYGYLHGLRCIGNVRLSVMSGKVVAIGPNLSEVLEATQRFFHERLSPGSYDRDLLTNKELAQRLLADPTPGKVGTYRLVRV